MVRMVFGMVLAMAALVAQDPAAVGGREQQFAQQMVGKLHELADAFAAQKQHARAYALRKELLLDYAPDDPKARDKCGFTKVGDLWRADAGKVVIEKDLTGDKKVLPKLEAQLQTLRKQQLVEHRALAQAWQAAGDGARAAVHWRRVLELAPGDRAAADALATQRFFGFVGTADELAMVRRAWQIRGAVDWLRRWEVPLEAATGEEPLLAKAGLAHRGVRSEHFAVWGTLPEAQLRAIAQYAERTWFLCQTLAGTFAGEPFVPERRRDLVFVQNDADYHRVLDQCADQFDAGRLQFLKNDVDMAFVKSNGTEVRFVKTNGGESEALDQAVRGVAQDAFFARTDGLWEGIGHAVCGFFFGRTLTFLLEQQDQKTVASYTQQLLLPDMAVWQKIAEQSAWAKSDSRTSELVLIHAARFSTEQRVKAWAICDYLWHWRPQWLLELDRSQSKDIHTPPDVEREFLRRTGFELPKLDHDWREFWAKKAALRQVMAADPLGDEKAKERPMRSEARAIVDAVNAARVAAWRGPLGFHHAEDAATGAALAYGNQLAKAVAQREKNQKQKKPVADVPLPVPPPGLGVDVLWSPQEPLAAVAAWLAQPAWRDRLLHPGQQLLGANRDKTSCVVAFGDAVQPLLRGAPLPWPRDGQRDVPGSAPVTAVGERLAAALRAVQPGLGAEVGMPLSLHFHRQVDPSHLARIACRVYAGNQRIEGLVVVLQATAAGVEPPTELAPGVVVFAPYAPLPAGAVLEATWELPAALASADAPPLRVRCTVKTP